MAKEKKAWIVLFKSRASMDLEAVVFTKESLAVQEAAKEAVRLAIDEIDVFGDEAPDELRDVVLAADRNDFEAAWSAWSSYASSENPVDSVEILEAPLVHGPKDWTP